MPTYDPRFDEYIENAQPFARPILKRLRKVVHAAVPDVQENWKWSNPAFDYKGIFCSMAAFKQHCIFGFWKHELLIDRGVIEPDDTILRHRGRITSVDDLPPDRELTRILKAAFSPSHKREYVEWVTEAKSEETRNRRLVHAVEWMAQGKPRNWKYL